MKYFIDTEFNEYTTLVHNNFFAKLNPINTIELISIGIVAEDGREYYAISKDFDIKSAWNKFDSVINKHFPMGPEYNKVYWIQENVLRPIYYELCQLDEPNLVTKGYDFNFTYKNFKKLIKKYGKSNIQIAEEIYKFVFPKFDYNGGEKYLGRVNRFDNNFVEEYWVKDIYMNPQFYGYYADYDWVVFCWLFGNMINLPKGFPMYCIDLKQTLDELQELENNGVNHMISCGEIGYLNIPLKERKDYPKQINEHNALADARWNKELYKFLKLINE